MNEFPLYKAHESQIEQSIQDFHKLNDLSKKKQSWIKKTKIDLANAEKEYSEISKLLMLHAKFLTEQTQGMGNWYELMGIDL